MAPPCIRDPVACYIKVTADDVCSGARNTRHCNGCVPARERWAEAKFGVFCYYSSSWATIARINAENPVTMTEAGDMACFDQVRLMD